MKSKSSCAFTHHPEFPNLPDKSPLTYMRTMNACLCEDPVARPSFSDILVLLEDLEREVGSGEYLNKAGCYQVCGSARSRCITAAAVARQPTVSHQLPHLAPQDALHAVRSLVESSEHVTCDMSVYVLLQDAGVCWVAGNK